MQSGFLIKILLLLSLVGSSYPAATQTQFTGNVVNSNSFRPLAYVNIGIAYKNIGTTTLADGSFSIIIPEEYLIDTLTFSMVGYYDVKLPIKEFHNKENKTIPLREKSTVLNEVTVTADKLVEKRFGIKRRNTLIHFTDGMFQESNDIFEIGQVIKFKNFPTQITSVNLHMNESRDDSATFRINFYSYDDNQVGRRIVEKSIIQRHPVKTGWLRFDLNEYNIVLKGKFMVAIEFLPEIKKKTKPIYYEVKLGGTSKSFYRRNSLGTWNSPPHHYCMHITALVDKSIQEDEEDLAPVPTLIIKSELVKGSFNIFVRLPKNYNRNNPEKYPVIYHVDGNAYFNHISNSVQQLNKNKEFTREPIVVGIGYENAYVMDSLRNRDYTFPEALPQDSFLLSGGGENFYQFIKSELIPQIDKTYQTDTTYRTIMGHSLGGYFTLYALMRDLYTQPLFNNYIAASPSIFYCDNYLFKKFRGFLTNDQRSKKLKLFMTMGQMEIGNDRSGGFAHFTQLLSDFKFLQLNTKVFKGLEHMGTAVPSFEEGIDWVF
jgi:predicted alpha/beta superfamily hydrolase